MPIYETGNSTFFRNYYAPETIESLRKEVAKRYPKEIVQTIVNGDYRAKDTFSLRAFQVSEAEKDGVSVKDALIALKKSIPIIRKDVQPDDIKRNPFASIEYDDGDRDYLDRFISHPDGIEPGEQDQTTLKAIKKAKQLLEENVKNERSKLSKEMVEALGPLEKVDVSKPKKQKQVPSVQLAQDMWGILGSEDKMERFAANLRAAQAEGSYLVVGNSEARYQADWLTSVLQRHGYTPDAKANEKLEKQRKEYSRNLFERDLSDDEGLPDNEVFVYLKDRR